MGIVYQEFETPLRALEWNSSAITIRPSSSSIVASLTASVIGASYGQTTSSGKESGTVMSFERISAFYDGRPMLPGTGLPAWIVAQMVQSGESVEDILEAYPFLTEELVERYLPVLHVMSLKDLGAPMDE